MPQLHIKLSKMPLDRLRFMATQLDVTCDENGNKQEVIDAILQKKKRVKTVRHIFFLDSRMTNITEHLINLLHVHHLNHVQIYLQSILDEENLNCIYDNYQWNMANFLVT